ncbi:Ku protein [Streptomyces sp. XY431]|uniref:non-homologous end joining protein Ku n=1 Tax=Streptomyces sp. XY431 TaxID=1415562 RepID=UPI000AE416F1|nr:Ku protein [Streptomyces sp. XY431]
MARPMWTGVLTFGLVTVPVALYTATSSHDVRFHQLQRGTSDRVRNKRVNERTGREVEFSEIVKGFEVTEGEYVVVEPEELEQISPGRSRTIDIAGFVDLADIDPIFFDKTYYLGPRGKEYQKVYALLVEALASAGKAGLAMFAMRGKEYLTAVRSENGLLELHTMHFADEVRDARTEVGDLPEKTELSAQEVRTAEQLIGMLAIDWKPEDWHDTYEEQVKEARGGQTRRPRDRRLHRPRAGGHQRRRPHGRPAPQPRRRPQDRIRREDDEALLRPEGPGHRPDTENHRRQEEHRHEGLHPQEHHEAHQRHRQATAVRPHQGRALRTRHRPRHPGPLQHDPRPAPARPRTNQPPPPPRRFLKQVSRQPASGGRPPPVSRHGAGRTPDGRGTRAEVRSRAPIGRGGTADPGRQRRGSAR